MLVVVAYTLLQQSLYLSIDILYLNITLLQNVVLVDKEVCRNVSYVVHTKFCCIQAVV